MKFSNQYAQLGRKYSIKTRPDRPQKPELVLWNQELAEVLGLDLSDEQIKCFFSGQKIATDSTPVALAYAGHQFGHFNPQLGDGRAHLLGELTDKYGHLQEVQLKGSGPTPFSRQGDGKCGIKPAVREYLMSEAMHAMRVPTTRSLAVVTTGEPVYRQSSSPGAVVTRVAQSHIRVGTFEYFAAREMYTEVKVLADLTLSRHFPKIDQSDDNKYIKLISEVIDNQIHLITEWMRVGFIHGVMNTDNTLLSGHTIDYGPCAMVGIYDTDTVFSSIDRNGRYSFGNQANMAQWNMARLAECFLPLIDIDDKKAIASLLPLIENFADKYNSSFNLMMAHKLGFKHNNKHTDELQTNLLNLMSKHQLDYTTTFINLQHSLNPKPNHSSHVEIKIEAVLMDWHNKWLYLLNKENIKFENARNLMSQYNPLVIPRNHHIEKILDLVEADTSSDWVNTFLTVIQSPYTITKNTHLFQDPSTDGDMNYQTFCGT